MADIVSAIVAAIVCFLVLAGVAYVIKGAPLDADDLQKISNLIGD